MVFDLTNLSREDFALAEDLRNESVVAVSGILRHRSEETYNPRIATGSVELKAQRLALLSQAQPLPFAIDDGAPVREELRLKYRYLDIRRPQMLANLRFRHLFQTVLGVTFDQPFPRLSRHEAMDTYGSDKPDLRFGLPIVDITEIAVRCGFSVFRSVADKGGVVRAINVKGCADFTRTAIEELTAKAVGYGAKGMAWIAYKPDGELCSILTKYLSQRELEEIFAAVDAKPGDFILF